jgi:hypothetical protein
VINGTTCIFGATRATFASWGIRFLVTSLLIVVIHTNKQIMDIIEREIGSILFLNDFGG